MPAGDKIQFDIEADDLFSAVLDKLIKGLIEANKYAEGFSQTNNQDVQKALDMTVKGFKELTKAIQNETAAEKEKKKVIDQVKKSVTEQHEAQQTAAKESTDDLERQREAVRKLLGVFEKYENILRSINKIQKSSGRDTGHKFQVIDDDYRKDVFDLAEKGKYDEIIKKTKILDDNVKRLTDSERLLNKEIKEKDKLLRVFEKYEKSLKSLQGATFASKSKTLPFQAIDNKYIKDVFDLAEKGNLDEIIKKTKAIEDNIRRIGDADKERLAELKKYNDQIEEQNKLWVKARELKDKSIRDNISGIQRIKNAEKALYEKTYQYITKIERIKRKHGVKYGSLVQESTVGAVQQLKVPQVEEAVKSRDLQKIIGLTKQLTAENKKASDAERSLDEVQKKRLERIKLSVQYQSKFGGQAIADQKQLAVAMRNYANAAREAGASTKEVSTLLDILRQSSKRARAEAQKLNKSERTLAEVQKKRLERVKLSVQYQAKFGGKSIEDQKQLAMAMRRYANAAREAGASTKEVSAMMDQLRQSSKRARAETQKLVKANKKQSDTFSKLVKDLSKVNVQYFTYTNILHDLEFGVDATARVIRRMTGSIIEAAGEMEKFSRTVRATEASAAAGDRRLNHLIQVGIDLVGASTQAIIKYNSQLRAAGVSAKEVDIIIVGITKSIAQLGKGTAETERVLRQISQAIAGNKLVLQDLRPILEEVPTFWARATQTFGVVIRDIETFRDHLDSIGVEKARGLIDVLTTIHEFSQGADMSTYSAQIELLTDQFEVMKAEIGKGLLPAVMIITDAMKGWLNIIRSMPTWVKSAIGVVIGLANVFTLFSGAITAAIALITIWHVKLGLNIVTKYIKNLTAGAAAAQAAGKALDAAQMSARALSTTLLRGTGIIGIAAAVVIGLGIAFANMQTSTKEAKNALEDLEDAIGNINRNILSKESLLQIKTSLEDEIDKIQRAGQHLTEVGKEFVNNAQKQISFIVNLTSGELDKIRSAISERTAFLEEQREKLRDSIDKLIKREMLTEAGLIQTHADIQRGIGPRALIAEYGTLTSDLGKIESTLKSLGLAEEFYTAEQSARDLEYELALLESRMKSFDRVFNNSKSPEQMRKLAEQMVVVAREIRKIEFDQEDLSKSDKLAINEKYYEEIRNIAEDLNKSLTKYYHDDYESYKKYTEHKIGIMLDFHKEREKGVKDRNKWEEDRTKEHLKRVRTIQNDAQKDFIKDFKEAQEKYSPANMLRYMFENQRDMMTYGFDKTGKNIAGALKNQQGGFVKQFQEALRIKDVEQRNEKLISLASDLQNRLDNITTLTESEKLAIVKEYSAKTQELWFAEVQAYYAYQQTRVKDHKDAVEKIHAEEIALNARQDSIDADIAEKGKKHIEDLLDWEEKTNEKGWDAIRKLRDKKEKEYEKQFKKMSNLQRKFANDMIGATLDLLFEQKSTFKEVVLAFIKSSLRIIAQSYVETEIRISNERRVQAAMAETQLFQIGTMQKTAQAALSTKSQIESLFNMFKGSLGGGGIAMAGASILAPGAFSNALGGASKDIGGGIVDMLGRGVDGLLSDFSETIRKNFGVFDSYKNDMFAGKHGEKMAYDIIKSKATQSAEDQQRHFDKNFRGKFDELIGSLGNISSESGPTIVNVYVDLNGKDMAKEVSYEIDSLLEEKRLTRRNR